MREKIKAEMIEWFKIIVTALIFALVITQFARPTLVRGESMYPTLEENDYLIINRMAYKVGEIKLGDIIVFTTKLKQENGEEKDLVKRVIAVEGDELKIEDSKIYVNDVLIEEPYINDEYTEGVIDITIPEQKVFVMGDNREESLDSRYEEVGLVDENNIMGKVAIRLFPLNKIGKLD